MRPRSLLARLQERSRFAPIARPSRRFDDQLGGRLAHVVHAFVPCRPALFAVESSQSILGYWNLSDGADDARFLQTFDAWARGYVRGDRVAWDEAEATLAAELRAGATS